MSKTLEKIRKYLKLRSDLKTVVRHIKYGTAVVANMEVNTANLTATKNVYFHNININPENLINITVNGIKENKQ